MATEWQTHDEKVAAFDKLYALDDTDESIDEGLEASMSILKRKRNDHEENHPERLSKILKEHHVNAKSAKLERTTSAPIPSKPSDGIAPARTLKRARTDLHVERADRSEKSQVVQLGNGLFDGLHFYFFPNNDINRARKIRIKKSLEHGAIRETVLTDAVTHLIVDRGITYSELLKFLRLDNIPSHIHVVHENYTADCYSYRSLLDPRQKSYHVPGYEVRTSTVKPREQASLQLKPATRDVQTREPFTPPQKDANSLSTDWSSEKAHHVDVQVDDTTKQVAVADQDELDLAIREVQEVHGLLLDDDDKDDVFEPDEGRRGLEDVSRLTPEWQKKFQCMQDSSASKEGGPNAYTIAILQLMADHYIAMNDTWRPISYRKAISTLRAYPVKVTTAEVARTLKGIGDRLAAKIEEISRTGFLQRLQHAEADPLDMALATFMKVYGIGFAHGMALIAAGHRTLEDLRTKATLNENQKIGLAHYDDFNTRIPRAEVKAHSDVVAKAVVGFDADLQVYTMGSFRRGAETSGDIDLIITHPSWSMSQLRDMLVKYLVPHLFKQDFLKCSLARTSLADGSKWHGASCLPTSTIWRRVDFLLVPAAELGAALIYFTGNDIFNRSMRLLASKKGMRLNQRGLYKDVMRGKDRVKVTEGELLEGRDERQIFAILGVPWREPEARMP